MIFLKKFEGKKNSIKPKKRRRFVDTNFNKGRDKEEKMEVVLKGANLSK